MSAGAGVPDTNFYLVSISRQQNLRPSVVWLESQGFTLENQSSDGAAPWPQHTKQSVAFAGAVGCISLPKNLRGLLQAQSREAFSRSGAAKGKALLVG